MDHVMAGLCNVINVKHLYRVAKVAHHGKDGAQHRKTYKHDNHANTTHRLLRWHTMVDMVHSGATFTIMIQTPLTGLPR